MQRAAGGGGPLTDDGCAVVGRCRHRRPVPPLLARLPPRRPPLPPTRIHHSPYCTGAWPVVLHAPALVQPAGPALCCQPCPGGRRRMWSVSTSQPGLPGPPGPHGAAGHAHARKVRLCDAGKRWPLCACWSRLDLRCWCTGAASGPTRHRAVHSTVRYFGACVLRPTPPRHHRHVRRWCRWCCSGAPPGAAAHWLSWRCWQSVPAAWRAAASATLHAPGGAASAPPAPQVWIAQCLLGWRHGAAVI